MFETIVVGPLEPLRVQRTMFDDSDVAVRQKAYDESAATAEHPGEPESWLTVRLDTLKAERLLARFWNTPPGNDVPLSTRNCVTCVAGPYISVRVPKSEKL